MNEFERMQREVHKQNDQVFSKKREKRVERMTANEFAGLVTDGIHPVIEFKKDIEDIESYAEPGMRARAVGVATTNDNGVKFSLDFTEFDDFNKAFEQANYYDKKGRPTLTAREAGFYKGVETYFFEVQDETDKYFEVVKSRSLDLYERYKSSKEGVSYVQWLEAKVTI
jgi:hypothetical protein